MSRDIQESMLAALHDHLTPEMFAEIESIKDDQDRARKILNILWYRPTDAILSAFLMPDNIVSARAHRSLWLMHATGLYRWLYTSEYWYYVITRGWKKVWIKKSAGYTLTSIPGIYECWSYDVTATVVVTNLRLGAGHSLLMYDRLLAPCLHKIKKKRKKIMWGFVLHYFLIRNPYSEHKRNGETVKPSLVFKKNAS